MKKSVVALCLFTGFLIAGSLGYCQQKNVSLRASLGMASPMKNNINTGLQSGFGFSVFMSSRICFSLDVGFWKSSVEGEQDALMDGEMLWAPLIASLEFYLLKEKRIRPYCYAGMGYIFSRMRIGEYYAIPEITIKQEVKSGPGIHAGTGLLVGLTKDLFLMADALFLFRKSTGTTIITDMNRGVTSRDYPVSLNSLVFRLGIRYNL